MLPFLLCALKLTDHGLFFKEKSHTTVIQQFLVCLENMLCESKAGKGLHPFPGCLSLLRSLCYRGRDKAPRGASCIAGGEALRLSGKGFTLFLGVCRSFGACSTGVGIKLRRGASLTVGGEGLRLSGKGCTLSLGICRSFGACSTGGGVKPRRGASLTAGGEGLRGRSP